METITAAGSNSLSASSSGTYTIGNGRCPKCGKPYVYVGDWFGGEPAWCTCAAQEKDAAPAAFDAWKLVTEMPIERILGLSEGAAQMSPDFDAPLQFAEQVDPAVLAEIKARALRIQDERSGRGKYKDLESGEANSLLTDLLLLIEALE